MTLTVSDLIDYLYQLPSDTNVVIDDEDFEGEGDYVSLRFLYNEIEQNINPNQ